MPSFAVWAIDIELADNHNPTMAAPVIRLHIRRTSGLTKCRLGEAIAQGSQRPLGPMALTTANVDYRASDDDASGDANIRTLLRHTSADCIDNRSTHNGAGSNRRSDTGDVDRCRPG